MSVRDRFIERTGSRYFLMRHGDATLGIPSGQDMMAVACRLADEPDKVKAEWAFTPPSFGANAGG